MHIVKRRIFGKNSKFARNASNFEAIFRCNKNFKIWLKFTITNVSYAENVQYSIPYNLRYNTCIFQKVDFWAKIAHLLKTRQISRPFPIAK